MGTLVPRKVSTVCHIHEALVNRILREGLRRLDEPGRPAERYETPSTDLGQCLVGDVDDVSEVRSAAEGDDFR